MKFEKLDRLPEEGYPKEKGQTYLAIVPNDVEAWLNGVCGDADCVDDQYANVRASGSTSSKRSSSPEAFDATSSFINPLFEEGGSGRGSSVNLHTSSLEMTELVDEYVDDKAAKASSLDIREVSGTA